MISISMLSEYLTWTFLYLIIELLNLHCVHLTLLIIELEDPFAKLELYCIYKYYEAELMCV